MSGFVRTTRVPPDIASRLAHLDVELTERCDNDCIHCCVNLAAGDRKTRAREMSTDHVKDVLRQAAALGCLQVRLTGGEPLLRRDFEDLYICARQLGMKVLIFTNARRITRRLAELWKRMPPLVPIEVTVYGMHQESYEAVSRVAGSYAQFHRGVELLLEYQVPFIVKGVLLPPNRHELDEFEAWAATIPAMEKRPGYSMFFDLRNRRDDPEKNRQIESLRVSPEEGVVILARDEERYRKEMNEFAAKFMGSSGDRLFACGAGRGMSIDAYGFAQPCMGMRAQEFTVDTRTSSLIGVLDRFAALRDLRVTNPEYLARCAKCSLKGLCEQCPAKSWAEHGTLDTPVEYLCDLAHAQARLLGWLGPAEKGWETPISVGERGLL